MRGLRGDASIPGTAADVSLSIPPFIVTATRHASRWNNLGEGRHFAAHFVPAQYTFTHHPS